MYALFFYMDSRMKGSGFDIHLIKIAWIGERRKDHAYEGSKLEFLMALKFIENRS